MTSKGTFTLPAKVRKELGLNKAGDSLLLQYHKKSGQIIIEKPLDLQEIQRKNAAIAKAKGIKPITDLHEIREAKHAEYYRAHFN